MPGGHAAHVDIRRLALFKRRRVAIEDIDTHIIIIIINSSSMIIRTLSAQPLFAAVKEVRKVFA